MVVNDASLFPSFLSQLTTHPCRLVGPVLFALSISACSTSSHIFHRLLDPCLTCHRLFFYLLFYDDFSVCKDIFVAIPLSPCRNSSVCHLVPNIALVYALYHNVVFAIVFKASRCSATLMLFLNPHRRGCFPYSTGEFELLYPCHHEVGRLCESLGSQPPN